VKIDEVRIGEYQGINPGSLLHDRFQIENS